MKESAQRDVSEGHPSSSSSSEWIHSHFLNPYSPTKRPTFSFLGLTQPFDPACIASDVAI